MCCLIVTLVPQKLFEFRYFMVPYMILQIFDPRQKDETRSWIIFQIIYNIAITTTTLYIFKSKGKFLKTIFSGILPRFLEIYWDDIEEVQRMFW